MSEFKTQQKLNDQQHAAVKHVEGPLLVLAGAGSGKTRIIIHRILHLLEMGVSASEILAVTFTNKAAIQMRERVRALSHASVLACTFHSLCARILRESISALGFSPSFVIFDEEDSEKVLKECIALLGLKDEKGLLKSMRAEISAAKNNLVDLDDEIYKLYQAKLKEYQALDFDDLLFLTVKLFRSFPDILSLYQKRWSFILIDEYQDTNQAQHAVIKLLSAKHHNVFAVGDPDQSIYSWRGADVHNILNFEKDYPNAALIRLEQNYRSTSTILNAANALIKHNTSRYEKNLWSLLGAGEKITLFLGENEQAETSFVVKELLSRCVKEKIPLSDCVIFYRTNSQSRVFEDALLRAKIPYVIVGGLSFYQRREIKDILALLRMVLGGSDFLSFARTVNLPKRGLGSSALEKLSIASKEHGWDILTTCAKTLSYEIPLKLSAKQMEGLSEYLAVISSLRNMQNTAIHELLSAAIERSHYLDHLKEDPETYEDRSENLAELVSKAAEWESEVEKPSLALFLEELSLKGSHDEKEPAQDSLRLMTVHNGKGLEFTTVFLVGLEEDLFPHLNSKFPNEALEEERRLFYVGMTRAKKYLYLTAARYRFLWGSARVMQPSRFLSEIPSEYMRELGESSSEEGIFDVGETVLHRDFGLGIIQKSYTTSLGLTYDVFFPKANSMRTLIAKYAKLLAVETPS